LLLAEGALTREQLERALAEQERTQPKTPLGEILLTGGFVSAPLLVRLLAQQCELQLEEETGFGTGLRRALELRHGERAPATELPAASAEPSGQATGVRQAATPESGPRLLGELLVQKRLLTNLELREALAEQAENGRLLGEIIVDQGFISMVELVNALTEQLQGERRRRLAAELKQPSGT
jgi:hypothetical protein